MQTLKLSVSLPDATHPDMELRLSANDSDCDVVIALPLRPRSEPVAAIVAGTCAQSAANSAEDDCVPGGHAGI